VRRAQVQLGGLDSHPLKAFLHTASINFGLLVPAFTGKAFDRCLTYVSESSERWIKRDRVPKTRVPNSVDSAVSVMNTATKTVVAQVIVGSAPRGVAITPGRGLRLRLKQDAHRRLGNQHSDEHGGVLI
jgi:YVTN family beta-propeller protein